MLVSVLALLVAMQATPATPDAPATPSAKSAPLGQVTATRAAQAPAINGKDDDPVWAVAPKITGFREFEPKVGIDPTFNTEFQVAYDARNLYVFVRMLDAHPDSIRHALSRRDVRASSDQIKLIIDSYDDKRTGYELAVNPDGVKRDYSISGDGNEDESWNGIWDVATAVDARGWTAEFRIPLSQLRYAGGADHTFGFGIWRDIERLAERSAWPEYSPTKNGLASQLGRLNGLQQISSARHFEMTPYAVTKNIQRVTPASTYNRNQQLAVGGDLKVGITPNVTLDATVNPDFGQVEADPAVLNLTAFETFVAEQRPFFVEGTGLYQFQLNCYIVVDCQTNEGLFYSRRIGRSPSLRGVYGDATTATATPITAAAKLTGRTGSGLSFGALEALTPRVTGPLHRAVEPASNYALVRAQQDMRGGEAGIGFIATAVDRSLDSLSSPFLHRSAYVTGLTFRNRFYKKQYEFAGQFAASQVNGDAAAIARTQRNSVHYYQQPENDTPLDTTRTSLSGHAEQVKFGKYGGGITRFETSVVRQSVGFDVNDMGYLQRADITDWSSWGALTFRDAKKFFRWAQFNANHWERWNTSGTPLSNAVNVNAHMGLPNNWNVHLGGTLSGLSPTYCDRCTRGGPTLRNARGFFPWGGINTDSRQVVSGGVFLNLRNTDEGRSTGQSWSPYVNVRFSTRLQLGIGAGYNVDHNDAQWFSNFTDATNVKHYTFAHLDQQTKSMNMRLNYTVQPNLTFEFYGQPFVASGTYSNVRETSATPHAASYVDRFRPYSVTDGSPMAFHYAQLRTNTVARWEYRPGSTLFLVWTHGREDSSNENPERSWQRDYRDLFRLHPDNTFLIKVAYWLNR